VIFLDQRPAALIPLVSSLSFSAKSHRRGAAKDFANGHPSLPHCAFVPPGQPHVAPNPQRRQARHICSSFVQNVHKLRRIAIFRSLRTATMSLRWSFGKYLFAIYNDVAPTVLIALSEVLENSPALQRWVLIQQNQASPVRDERMVLPSLAGLISFDDGCPSHEWLGYFLMRPICGAARLGRRPGRGSQTPFATACRLPW